VGIAANWSRENIAWCAALFEGEGCINITPRTVILKLGMTDEDVVRRFHKLIGIGKVSNPIYHKTVAHYKPHWDWYATGSEKVQAILAAFWPFLGARRQARAVEAIAKLAKSQRYGDRTRHCSKGHEFTAWNTRISGRGLRVCKACAKDITARWRLKNKKKNDAIHDVYRIENGGDFSPA
jgi:hypothetical protein